MDVMCRCVKSGDLCFDIGACTLEKSFQMLNLGAKRVIAVEPQAEMLKLNSTDDLTVVPKAVSYTIGTAEFSICSSAYTISTMAEHWKEGRFKGSDWSKKITVQTTTLDELIELYGLPDYCKVDVEGHEVKVLLGLTRPIPLLSFEWTKEFISEALSCATLLHWLGKYEYNFTIGSQHADCFELVNWCELKDLLKNIKYRMVAPSDDWGDIYARIKK